MSLRYCKRKKKEIFIAHNHFHIAHRHRKAIKTAGVNHNDINKIDNKFKTDWMNELGTSL